MIKLPLAKIRKALNNVVETFATTPITYHRQSGAQFDRFKEGNNKAYENITVNGFVEYNPKEIERDLQGAANFQGCKIMFKADEWIEKGLYEGITGKVLANTTTDYLTISGKKYKIVNIMPDGAFETNNVIITVLATLQPKT